MGTRIITTYDQKTKQKLEALFKGSDTLIKVVDIQEYQEHYSEKRVYLMLDISDKPISPEPLKLIQTYMDQRAMAFPPIIYWVKEGLKSIYQARFPQLYHHFIELPVSQDRINEQIEQLDKLQDYYDWMIQCLELLSEGVLLLREETILGMNAEAATLLRLSRHELINKSYSKLLNIEPFISHKNKAQGNILPYKEMECWYQKEEYQIKLKLMFQRSQSPSVPFSILVMRKEQEEESKASEEEKRSGVVNKIISRNAQMKQLLKLIPTIASSQSTTLIEGETGTGKELIAKAIYESGPRRDNSFISLNCGALPDTLLESELFGYKAGAFTDAKKDKEGYFSAAKGGILFLDEIGEMSESMQIKLLRVLERGEYQPLGSTQTKKLDIQLICATNKNLQERVQQGRFRSDFFYRINIFKIKIPSLSERKEDIPLLIHHFIEKINIRTNRQVKRVSDEVMNILSQYSFPGNIRELENIIEHAVVLCKDEVITKDQLPNYLFSKIKDDTERQAQDLDSLLQKAEKEAVSKSLIKHEWNYNKVMEELGISRSSLWRKIKQHNLKGSIPFNSLSENEIEKE